MWIAVAILTICLAALTIGCAMTWRDLEDRIKRLEDRWAQDRAEGWSDQK